MMVESTYSYEPYEYSNEWGEGYVSPTEMVSDYGWEYKNSEAKSNGSADKN